MSIKYIVITALAIALSGCVYQTVNSNDWRKAEFFCKNKAGVEYVVSTFAGDVTIHCNNGDSAYKHNVKEL